jgi:hypothetical protein
MKQIIQGSITGLIMATALYAIWAPHDMIRILNHLI